MPTVSCPFQLEDGKAKVEELRSVFESQRFQVASLRSQLIKKTDEINFIMDEKVCTIRTRIFLIEREVQICSRNFGHLSLCEIFLYPFSKC